MAHDQKQSAIDLSVVIPIHDEEENLRPLDEEIRAVLKTLGLRSEIVYVDDRSRDRSWSVLVELMKAPVETSVETQAIRLRRNYGQTAAMAAGFQWARGAVVVAMDGDGQNNPADIPRLLEKLDEGYDVVSGWRRNRMDKAISRKLPSRVANWLIGFASGLQLHDNGCTLKAYRASCLNELRLYGEMHRFIPLYLANQGARIAEIVVDHRPRQRGQSKYGGRRIFKVALDLLLIWFVTRYYARPMHFFGQLSIAFFFATWAVFFCMLVFRFGWLRLVGIDFQADFISTPLPALAATFFLGFIITLCIGVQTEVLVRVHYEARDVRPYSIETIENSWQPGGHPHFPAT